MIRVLSSQSVLGRLEIAMAILAVAAIASFANLVVFAENSTGKAGAINLAGSLRMQSYAIGLALADTGLAGAERETAVLEAVGEFDRRLNHPGIASAMSSNRSDPLARAFAALKGRWNHELRPLVQRSAGQPAVDSQEAVRSIRSFVAEVDQFVARLDETLESQIATLKLIQGAMLFLMLITIFVAIFMLHEQLNATLSNLLRFARRVRKGDFTVRAPAGGGGEFAELSEAFNFMAEDLSRMYATLEAQVAQKTAELERTNRSLSLLYDTARTLSGGELTTESMGQILKRVEAEIGLPTVAVCAYNPNQVRGFPLAVNAAKRMHPETHAANDCSACHAARETQLRPDPARPGGSILNVPLVDGGHYFGTIPVVVPPGAEIAPWQIELMEAIGRQIGSAMAGLERNQQERRVALLEERSAMARELHDSLAQALSYLKIQVTRLTRLLDAQDVSQARNVVGELRTGLNNAYRQLRELLTTFRLRFDGKGLEQALRDVIDEFRRRGLSGLEVTNKLAEIELSANEQLHVLQIIRESLSNIEHHAQTSNAWVSLERDELDTVRIRIEDDGVGIREARAEMHHYGTSIMRDRAESLGGSLTIATRAQGGTCVELRFQPQMSPQETNDASLVYARERTQ
jgi:two-component system nitrate/nitrite sensor histidine kinase NarX